MERPAFIVSAYASLGRLMRFVAAETDITDIKVTFNEKNNRVDAILICDVGKLKDYDRYSRHFRDEMVGGVFLYRCQPTPTRLLLSIVDDVQHQKILSLQQRGIGSRE